VREVRVRVRVRVRVGHRRDFDLGFWKRLRMKTEWLVVAKLLHYRGRLWTASNVRCIDSRRLSLHS